MMKALLLLVALFASACVSDQEPVEYVAESYSTVVPVEIDASGIDAIDAAQGTPHILWFWGAN